WTKSELDLFPLVADLQKLIRDNSKDEGEYKRYFGSLKNSVLTAFYTPPEIIKAIEGGFRGADIFYQPVSFNQNEIAEVDNSMEALSASLNKFGEVKFATTKWEPEKP
ncbi:MAG: hypothetical protein LBR75_01845, partial [Prevotellaceae bacterium]|nr:hypothetical protein [Prevotellaceae bacterium]